jgi:molybdenum cofactor biosynthesis protein MoaC
MIDVTGRSTTLRRATAEARVTMRPETAAAVREGRVPKGDVAEMTRAVAMLGLKRTPDLLPFCHRIPVEHAAVRVEVEEAAVRVTVEVASIARTGVEVEAMTGAAIAALNVYDMVKPIDPEAAIGEVRVVAKSGGRSDHQQQLDPAPTAGVLVVSDSVAAGRKSDRAGAAVREALTAAGVEVAAFEVVPDEPEEVSDRIRRWVDDDGLALVFAVGGTGLGPRDRTPEATRPLLDREIPGVVEAIRDYGRERTPYAALSRAVAGQRGRSVVLALPGSTRGAAESMAAVMPWLLHVLEVIEAGFRHGE